MFAFYFFSTVDTESMAFFAPLFVFIILTDTRKKRFEFFSALRTVANCHVRSTMIEIGARLFRRHHSSLLLKIQEWANKDSFSSKRSVD